MKVRHILLTVAALSTVALRAQSPADPSPRFEVAAIKPNTSGLPQRSFRVLPGNELAATNVTVRHLMWNAFGVQDFQISGGPGWIGSERFDVVAKGEPSAPREQVRLMLRSLLIERFKLRAHLETQDRPVLALVVARPGRVTPAKAPCGNGRGNGCGFQVGAGVLHGRSVTVARLVDELTGVLGTPVIDRTALAGEFDIDLEWAPDLPGDGRPAADTANDSRPSLFTAVQEQLGLKLDSQRGPVQMLVVEGVEHPSGN